VTADAAEALAQDACAAFLIQLAFTVPPGTDLRPESPIGLALRTYVAAIRVAATAEMFVVTDGSEDRYGLFSTRARAQAWIDRQRALKYPWWDGLVIEEWLVDEAPDLQGGKR
jgi:hypothetical protein